ncbi:MAG: TlyA family RNA methyltransferase [Lachnospiraceae bacterium]|nr:TlyA family RNA methyltransferase [Lachnospiraceae bacterium]
MKERLDILLVRGGFFPSREKAKSTIMAGQVYVNGQKEDKAGMKFDTDSEIEVRGKTLRYVSRGGLKLEKAINEFGIDPAGKVCLDIGASTGGFTDCMLQNGAVRVYSVDVGHGQLDWQLRRDERVVCMEHFNARTLSPDDLPERVQLASADVSFISLKLILAPALSVLDDGGEIAALIKPQFEAGREQVGKKGVVRDPKVHESVITEVLTYASGIGLKCEGLTWSPITGPEGNIEYLAHFKKDTPGEIMPDIDIASVVLRAHEALE